MTSPHPIERPLGALIAALAAVGLIVQYGIIVAAVHANGGSVLLTSLTFFGYFTILSNLLAAVGLVTQLVAPLSTAGRFFSRPTVRAGTALYLIIVGLVYTIMLRHLWSPTGWQKLADVLLHDLVPPAYLLYWLFVLPRARLPWKSAVTWLLFPLVYFGYTLVRAPFFGGYPYPFLDAGKLGYGPVLRNALVLLPVFYLLGLALVAIDRRSRGRSAT